MSSLAQRLSEQSSMRVGITTTFALGLVISLIQSEAAFKNNSEFPIKRADYNEAMTTIASSLPPNDTIVTNRAGALDLLHKTQGDENSYEVLERGIVGAYGKTFRFLNEKNSWEYNDAESFSHFVIQTTKDQISLPSQDHRVTFIVLKMTDFSMLSLYNCVSNRFGQTRFTAQGAGYLMFDASVDELQQLLGINGERGECFENSTAPRNAEILTSANFRM